MKLSFKLQEDKTPVLKARIPVSIFSQPLVSSLITTTPTTTTDNSHKSSQTTSFSLCTNYPSGPSLKLSYAPSNSTTTTTTTTVLPFSLSLKSGLGLFGSPKESPLVFSAQFSLSSVNPGTIIPSFSLHFKPQFGNFSFYKATSSQPSLEPDSGSHLISAQPASPSNSDFGTPDSGSVWQEVKLEPHGDGPDIPKFGYGNGLYSNGGFGLERSLVRKDDKKSGVFGGIAVRARTLFPVTKRATVNLRWIVNWPSDVESKSNMPYLTINKIGIEKVDEVTEVKEVQNKNNIARNEDDLELLKGMYSWMRRDLDMLENENREMKQYVEDMRHEVSARKASARGNEGVGWRASSSTPPPVKNSNEFERWRNKKNSGEDNGGREVKKNNANKMSEMEIELQKAIKAAPT